MYQIPYDTPSLQSVVRALWVGQLRYPGGTKANYFYIPNASYALPCAPDAHSHADGSEGVGGSHDQCSLYETFAQWPQ